MKPLQIKQNNSAMTLMEVLIVVSLISLVSVTIYNSLSNGIKVWKRSQQLVIEEDVSLLFEKLARDLHNAYPMSTIPIEGDSQKFSFPTIVHVPIDDRSGADSDEYVDQLGKVKYYYDPSEDAIYRADAGYGQAVHGNFNRPVKIVSFVKRLNFQYVYVTEDGEVVSHELFETLPSALEIEVVFSDKIGERSLRKIIDVPIGG